MVGVLVGVVVAVGVIVGVTVDVGVCEGVVVLVGTQCQLRIRSLPLYGKFCHKPSHGRE